ncbi:twin-arginine translocation signal domain-containing protein (plasmid) [Halobaculum sp. CBA1158]|uniref:twin-arginine translocation signal domain-containing protein n=1 Tax=Halobaculum sp. CBA1158 TaxID=2904243 RepID=UPI001F1EF87E|nr:twin-arginine translocation signal domain-containing protein [Halobaculum sp. CBA1158]UIP01352.1 twin-arginine translocation signal domain-containing protein [Halobaculum sp. CBA1158]
MPSRRDVLKGGAAVGAASVTGLSGCLGGVLGGGSSNFQNWLIDPYLLPGQPERYPVVSLSPSSLEEHSGEFDGDEWDQIRTFAVQRYQFTRLYADEVDRLTLGGGGYQGGGFEVTQGGFDGESVGEDLTRAEFRELQEYQSYSVYERDQDRQLGIGIDGGTMAAASSFGDADAIRVLEDLIDVQRGEVRSYSEVNDTFGGLMDASTPGDVFTARITGDPADETDAESGQFRNQVGQSTSASVNGEDSDLELVLTFLSDRDPRERDLEEWTLNDRFDLWRDIEISVDGASATVSGSVPTRDVFSAINF